MVSQMACHHWFSHEKATKQLGYYPIVSLQDGIQRTIDHFTAKSYRQNREKNPNLTYIQLGEEPE